MRLAVFDFDGTLFPKQTIPYLMKYYLELGYSKGKFAVYMAKGLTKGARYKLPIDKAYGKEQFRQEVTVKFIQMFNGQSPEVVEQFFDQVTPHIVANLNPMVVEEVRQAKERGEHCILLSGCFTSLLERIAQHLGIDEVIGTDIYTGNVKQGKLAIGDLDIGTGPKKVQWLKERMNGKVIDWENSRAYGDSSYDQYILALVGNPVAVNPEETLRKLAEEKQWSIMVG